MMKLQLLGHSTLQLVDHCGLLSVQERLAAGPSKPFRRSGSLRRCYFFSAVFSVWARKSMRYCFHTMAWVWVP
jgi:hypothetical protein